MEYVWLVFHDELMGDSHLCGVYASEADARKEAERLTKKYGPDYSVERERVQGSPENLVDLTAERARRRPEHRADAPLPAA